MPPIRIVARIGFKIGDTCVSTTQDANDKAHVVTLRGSELWKVSPAAADPADNNTTSTLTSEEESLLEELNAQCTLTKQQRICGALSCHALGALFSFLSTLLLMSHHP